MLENRVKEFLKEQFRDWDDSFKFTIEHEDDTIIVAFHKIFSEPSTKEISFLLIDNNLHIVDLGEGYQDISNLRYHKFFWITLLCD